MHKDITSNALKKMVGLLSPVPDISVVSCYIIFYLFIVVFLLGDIS